ncbi:unnamed protein product [Colias eurytheme]|nr:unnamed protein product [Colias eurytheme]
MPYYQPQRPYYGEYDYRRWSQPRQNNRMYRRGGGRMPEYSIESNYEYDRYRNCKCSCKNCDNLKPCCVSICDNCNPQSNLVFVPYPVPLVVTIQSKNSPNSTSATNPTTKTTTTSTTSTTTTTRSTTTQTTTEMTTTRTTAPYEITTYSTPLFPTVKNRDFDYEISTFPFFEDKKLSLYDTSKPECSRGRCKLKNYRRVDYIDGLLRNENDRNILRNQRTEGQNDKYFNVEFPSRSNWAPRYGIVPIPDKLALKFMTHLRDMKMQNLEKVKQ